MEQAVKPAESRPSRRRKSQ